MSSLFNDRRASGLLSRVREDISNLREDIGDLLSHTTHKTLPNSAKDLAEQAKSQLAAGGAYAVSRFRDFRGRPSGNQASWIGGAVVLGLIAVGTYALCRECCRAKEISDDYDSDEDTPV